MGGFKRRKWTAQEIANEVIHDPESDNDYSEPDANGWPDSSDSEGGQDASSCCETPRQSDAGVSLSADIAVPSTSTHTTTDTWPTRNAAVRNRFIYSEFSSDSDSANEVTQSSDCDWSCPPPVASGSARRPAFLVSISIH